MPKSQQSNWFHIPQHCQKEWIRLYAHHTKFLEQKNIEMADSRARIFKLKEPRIDSRESILPAFVAWRALFLLDS